MGWSIGYDTNWERDIGYGVPAVCDHPDCDEEIDRGLSYVCGGDAYGGDHGCGLFFCDNHLNAVPVPVGEEDENEDYVPLCERCAAGKEPFEPKPDTEEWTNHKMTHESWAEWRKEQGIEERK